jgi:DNA-binding transcriptional LysR family regulator
MLVTRTNLTDLAYFLAIARHRNLRRAGLELGVSASAVSHALKSFEERAGVRLINRTNRSVTLTSAGKALEQSVSGSFADIGSALENLDHLRASPGGKIRINAVVDAVTLVLGPACRTVSPSP